MNRARKQQFTVRLQPTELSIFQDRRVREAIVEARLQALTDFVESIDNADYSALLPERSATREAVEELSVKESALRWIVRVARHSEGFVRERLWRDIEKALADLETLAGSVRNSGKVLPFPDSSVLGRESAEALQTWGSVT
jgi:hypothetical protein